MVRFCLEGGADGLACLLFAGEFYKFSDAERSRVAGIVVDECNGRVPVLVGVSHSGTLPSIELGLRAADAGADGVIVTPPYHANFLAEASLSVRSHFEAVASRLDLPVMIQDYETPGGVRLAASDLEGIARASDNVRYVKIEGGDHLTRIRETRALLGDRMGVFGGMAGRYLLEELALGSQGSIPGAEMVDVLAEVFGASRRGDRERAGPAFARLLPYLDFLVKHFDSFVAVEKEVLRARGVIGSSTVRSPAVPLGADATAALGSILREMGLSPGAGSRGPGAS